MSKKSLEEEYERDGGLPVGAYEMYIRGIESYSRDHKCTYEVAAQALIQDAIHGGGDEHIDLIKAALKFLLEKK